MTGDPLVLATYALVVATVALVVAAVLPPVLATRRSRARHAAQVVPPINMIHPRAQRLAGQLARTTKMDLPELDRTLDAVELCIGEVNEVLEKSFAVSLKFANEMHLVRHFLSCAAQDLEWLASLAERATGGQSTHHDHLLKHPAPHRSESSLSEEARLGKVAANLLAANESLNAAESLLPRSARTVDGERFWDRYRATLEKRFDEAEKGVVDLRRAKRGR